MEWISIWAQQIIVAVIIATIIEMVLPSGNNKKYIKTVIGVYILFTIISPILTNSYGKDFELNLSEYENYFKESETYTTLSEGFEKSTSQSIENTYISSLKQDIKKKLENKQYEAEQINLEVELEDEKKYGEVKKMEIEIRKIDNSITQNNNNETTNKIGVNKIEIGNETTLDTNKSKKQELDMSEKMELVQYLCEEYGVDINNITII